MTLNIVPLYPLEGSYQIPSRPHCDRMPAPPPALSTLGTVNVFDLHQSERGNGGRSNDFYVTF